MSREDERPEPAPESARDPAPSARWPALACDVMLGRLARWLRILGVDTAYRNDWRLAALCNLAHREGRILLTRNVAMTRRRDAPPHLLVRANEGFAQLVEVCRALGLGPSARCFTRCLRCNEPLVERGAEAVADRLFPHVRDTQDRFVECGACGHLYWEGTHPTRIRETLERLDLALAHG